MCRVRNNLTFQQFGELTVTGYAGTIKRHSYQYAVCKHGVEHLVRTDRLLSGEKTTCSCKPKKSTIKEKKDQREKHGYRYTPEYRAWSRYKSQQVFPEIWNDFVEFFCDVGERPCSNARLSRRDMSQPHGPSNTYWRDRNAEQQERSLDLTAELCVDFDAILRSGTAAA